MDGRRAATTVRWGIRLTVFFRKATVAPSAVEVSSLRLIGGSLGVGGGPCVCTAAEAQLAPFGRTFSLRGDERGGFGSVFARPEHQMGDDQPMATGSTHRISGRVRMIAPGGWVRRRRRFIVSRYSAYLERLTFREKAVGEKICAVRCFSHRACFFLRVLPATADHKLARWPPRPALQC